MVSKLDRMATEAPPKGPSADQAPVHPDVKATGELLASLEARAARGGASSEAWQEWLEARQIPRTGDGEPILTSQDRGVLASAFNEALAQLKTAQARKAPRRQAAKGA